MGITDKLSVVLCGENVPTLTEESTTTQSLSTGSVENPRRVTLFEDLFGKSVLVDPKAQRKAIEPSKWRREDRASQNVLLALFKSPAQTLPPIESLFSRAMETFIPPRPEEPVQSQTSPRVSEDVPMDVVEDETRPVHHREVPQEELDELTTLFQSIPVPQGKSLVRPRRSVYELF
jgi:hypothetical protein